MSSNPNDNLKISAKIDSKYRKIYRSLVEKSKKLDEIYKSENSFLRIFQPETTLLREKLKSCCETLIFREPIEFAKKAEEILWRKAFYEVINIVKSNKKSLKCNAEIETMYRMHLSSAYGFYNHLLLRFQSEFYSVIRLDGFLNLSLVSFDKPTISHSQEKSELLKEVAIRILHKFLICLGDLARYQTEYDPHGSTHLPYKYYRMSLTLLPSNGTPLNQLGTLYGSENYGCDAAYYYLYCLSCSEPFFSARENLRLVFSKNRRRYEEIKSSTTLNRLEEQRSKEIKRFLVSFLGMIDYVLSNSSLLTNKEHGTFEKIENQRLHEMCQQCLQQFNSCMFYVSNEDECVKASAGGGVLACLTDELVFKLTLVVLMTIEHIKLKKVNNQSASAKPQLNVYFTFVAFALVFFSHMVNHTIMRLEESLMSSHTNRMLEKCKLDADEDDESSLRVEKAKKKRENKTKSEEGAEKKPSKRNLRLIYGHRRRKHNSDSDTNEDEDDEGSSLSENDESKVFNEFQEIDSDEEEEEDDDDDDDRTRSSMRTKRRNVAKFIERENLSETEINDADRFSNSSTDTSTEESRSDSEDVTSSSSSSDSDDIQAQKETIQSGLSKKPNEKPTETSVQEFPATFATGSSQFGLNSAQTHSNTNQFNFKELSIQLLSNFSSQGGFTTTTTSLGSSTGSAGGDEFIDNEIYKFVLNGGRNSSEMSASIEMNPKEAYENEELGKKIATFQIETDSEENSEDERERSEKLAANTESTVSSSKLDKIQRDEKRKDRNGKSSKM